MKTNKVFVYLTACWPISIERSYICFEVTIHVHISGWSISSNNDVFSITFSYSNSEFFGFLPDNLNSKLSPNFIGAHDKGT